eukprot:CAMPEP_0184856990 /NCGR_PEP_ID=MMETSP0580-20130426/2152_1 /TAXON_ID=1118495 /ORGANISM="Dactyliosolen fragilissimus" /LENGTH=790 /DNA_ID=CAMNT_0027352329 /DNA_START=269 /DNA_END=2641 /DNA_ORIENTATION=+
MKQLHAGQLRYHDFHKLREACEILQSRRNASSSSSSSSSFSRLVLPSQNIYFNNPNNNNNHHLYSQNRSFLTSTLQSLKLKSLERNADRSPQDVNAQYEFLSQLSKQHPHAVIQRFEQFNDLAIDERCALLYFGALQRTDSLHSFDIQNFISRIKHNHSAILADPLKLQELEELQSNQKQKSSHKFNKHQLATQAMRILAGVTSHNFTSPLSSSSSSSPILQSSPLSMIARGADPKNPIHVQMNGPSTTPTTALLTMARHVLIAFIVVSGLTAILDEKGMGRAMGMGGTKHIQEAEKTNVQFDHVKGVDEAKAELEEIVEYLKNPARFTRLGGKLPRGLLLTGPPGTGKTLLAKAIAGEADVPFFFASGSQFEEVYVGLGAKRVRELFEAAKKKAPSIIFIDEIDAVGGTRKLKDQSALKMTLNELLVQLDGFEENSGIIVIGATNFAEALDSALLRPGRFDKHVTVPLPDVGGRKEILEMYSKRTTLDKDVDLSILARGTTGFSGADLFNLMNQAALKASMDGLQGVTMASLEYAKDKILMGAERKTAVITPKTARCTAFHEAGHALVATLTEGAQPIHKATIMPRGSSLGMVTMLPEGDQTSQSLREMKAFMDVAMGGRVAEELTFGAEDVTSGAMSDLANATRTARAMVTKYGFSDNVGVVYHGGNAGEEDASAETRARIDEEVRNLTDAAYNRARNLLKKYSREHKLLAETLLEYETLTGDEVRHLIKTGSKPNRPIVNKDKGARGDASVLKGTKSSDTSDSEKSNASGGGNGVRGTLAGSRRDRN